MGKWNANKIQSKSNQLSRGPDTRCLDTLTPRTLDKVQDLLCQVIYPDIRYIAVLIEIYFLDSGKTAMQSIPSSSTTQVTVSPMLSSKFESGKRERNPVKSAGTAEGDKTQYCQSGRHRRRSRKDQLSVSHKIQTVLHCGVGLGEEIRRFLVLTWI